MKEKVIDMENKIKDADLKLIYHTMIRIREFEERIVVEFRKGNIPGFIHISSGQEAIPAGIMPFIKEEDYYITTHRGHGDIISKGVDLNAVMAELFARETGYCRGKGGSMHVMAFDKNVVGSNGIVGANVPIASGVALACKKRKSGVITVCFLGDGATCTGAFHEGLEFASVFDLPVIFVICNNQFALSTNVKFHSKRLKNLSEKAKAYGIPSVTIDGNDAIAVAEAASEVVEKTRSGKGPMMIEGLTYRYYGHNLGDSGLAYRTKEEIENMKINKDPIIRMFKLLKDKGILTDEENKKINDSVKSEMDKSVEFALNSKEASGEEALKDVYCDM